VERDLQVLGVGSWRELVIDREKWRGIVRQAKPHSGLQRQRKKKKNSIIISEFLISVHLGLWTCAHTSGGPYLGS
jgi:hypothetical protein